MNGFPFGKLMKLVLSMYSTFYGLAVMMVLEGIRWRMMTFCDGDPEKRQWWFLKNEMKV